jgi:hypothetical protein
VVTVESVGGLSCIATEDDIVSTTSCDQDVSGDALTTIDDIVACAFGEVGTVEVGGRRDFGSVTVKVFIAIASLGAKVVEPEDSVVAIVALSAAIPAYLVASSNLVVSSTSVEKRISTEQVLALDSVVASLATNFVPSLLRRAGQVSVRDHVDCVVSLTGFNVD